jgi:hypothetical protein
MDVRCDRLICGLLPLGGVKKERLKQINTGNEWTVTDSPCVMGKKDGCEARGGGQVCDIDTAG